MLSVSQVNQSKFKLFTVKHLITPASLSEELKRLNLKLLDVTHLEKTEIEDLYKKQCDEEIYFIFAEDKYISNGYDEYSKAWEIQPCISRALDSQENWAANCVFVVTDITSTGSG
jgi:hypothetical protein